MCSTFWWHYFLPSFVGGYHYIEKKILSFHSCPVLMVDGIWHCQTRESLRQCKTVPFFPSWMPSSRQAGSKMKNVTQRHREQICPLEADLEGKHIQEADKAESRHTANVFPNLMPLWEQWTALVEGKKWCAPKLLFVGFMGRELHAHTRACCLRVEGLYILLVAVLNQ